MSAPPLRLAAPSWRRIREQATAAWPDEACGFLFHNTAAAAGRGTRANGCRNIASAPERAFLIEPEDLLRLEQALRLHAGAIVGVWHSHPHGGAAPSPSDRAAAWPGWIYLIVGTQGQQVTESGAWRVDQERWQPLPVYVENGGVAYCLARVSSGNGNESEPPVADDSAQPS